MGILSIFKKSNYFDKSIVAKCDYCSFGKRAKDGNKIICEHRGLVDPNNSCGKFDYSPLKRIPVKQLNFVGSLADDDIYIESAGDRAEKEAARKAEEEKNKPKTAPKPEPAVAPEPVSEAPAEEDTAASKTEPEAPTEESSEAPEETSESAE